MRPEDRVRIRHMIEATETIQQFIAGRDREVLQTDRMLLFAIQRAVEIIGEAASRVTQETRSLAPDIPWTQIAAMRNRLVHAYFDVDTNILWATVTEEIGPLRDQLRKLAGPD